MAPLVWGETETKRQMFWYTLILIPLTVLPFDQIAADRFGLVAASLARQGTPIGAYDTLIAAHALALGRVFVTNNLKHFNQVAGLQTETWL